MVSLALLLQIRAVEVGGPDTLQARVALRVVDRTSPAAVNRTG
jgi:hypothetical protein